MKFLNRKDEIIHLCAGRDVLHLGCVGFTDAPTEQRNALAGTSLHAAISKVANTIGIDYNMDAIEYFRISGVFSNVIYGNAEMLDEVDLDRVFDVVVCGDLIEHLSNPGLMLDGVRRFMKPDAILVVTTPNAFGGPNIVRYATGSFREGGEHVASYNAQNIRQLIKRHGYAVQAVDTCYQTISEELHSGAVFSMGKAILGLVPAFGGTLFVRASLQH
jgi:2-polyprenyl-3-methyl-5-hydroxy-6-metoxy-1,4-benzoquinol methylase